MQRCGTVQKASQEQAEAATKACARGFGGSRARTGRGAARKTVARDLDGGAGERVVPGDFGGVERGQGSGGKRDGGRGSRWGCGGTRGVYRATRRGVVEAQKVAALEKRRSKEGEAANRERGSEGGGCEGNQSGETQRGEGSVRMQEFW